MNEEFSKKIRHYQGIFGLQNWKITLVYANEDVENHKVKTYADPRYNLASMTIYPRLLKEQAEWDETIVHELIHVVMALYDFFADNLGKEESDELFAIARENATSQLTNIIMRLI